MIKVSWINGPGVLFIHSFICVVAQVHHAAAGSGGGSWPGPARPSDAPCCGGLRRPAGRDTHHGQVCHPFQHQAPPPAHLRWRSAARQLHGSCELKILPLIIVCLATSCSVIHNLQCLLCSQLESWPDTIRSKFSYTVYSISFPKDNAAEWKKLFKPCASQRLFLPVCLA